MPFPLVLNLQVDEGGHFRRLEAGYRHLGCFKRSPDDIEMDMMLEETALTLHVSYFGRKIIINIITLLIVCIVQLSSA